MFNNLSYELTFDLQGCVLGSRKSNSTPSLSEVNEDKASVASTEQAASAENLTATVKSVSIYIFQTSFATYFTYLYILCETSAGEHL